MGISTAREYVYTKAALEVCRESEARMRALLKGKGLSEEEVERGLGPVRSFGAGLAEEVEAYERGRGAGGEVTRSEEG
jgi:hypothetical protein